MLDKGLRAAILTNSWVHLTFSWLACLFRGRIGQIRG